jgi:VanZ family protein
LNSQADNSLTLQYPLLWNIIGCFAIGLVFYLSLHPHPSDIVSFPFVDKFEHLIVYCLLMGWFAQIYVSRRPQLILAILFCLMGVLLEILQGMGGHRYFEYTDMAANTAGVFLGWWLSRNWCTGWLVRVDQVLSRQ